MVFFLGEVLLGFSRAGVFQFYGHEQYEASKHEQDLMDSQQLLSCTARVLCMMIFLTLM